MWASLDSKKNIQKIKDEISNAGSHIGEDTIIRTDHIV